MDISRAANLIHFATFIIQVCLYQSSIINSKTLSIIIVVQFSIGFNDTVVRLYTDYESLCAGTYSITIYCGYSLDFIIGYFKTLVMQFLILILMEFLLVLVTIILRLLLALLHGLFS